MTARSGGSAFELGRSQPSSFPLMAPSQLEWLYGRNPVLETLRAGRRVVRQLQVARGVERQGALATALSLAEAAGIPIEQVPRRTLDSMPGTHQGIAAQVEPFPYASLADLLEAAAEASEPALFLLLDLIQNPQNLGTLLRTAEAVGVHGVILPPRRGVGVTPAVVAASAGASEHLLIAVENLAQAITRLKQAEVWIYGLERSAEARPIDAADLSGAAGLVIGSEGEGMRRLVRESCDFLLQLPMRGRIDSLNAAVAGSIALYAFWAARGYPGIVEPPAAR